MTTNHSDDADELIARAARDYNQPGAVPREDMWNRIVEARRSPAATRMAPSVGRTRYWVWPSVGVAAAGLIAVGVAIGRQVERSNVRQRVDSVALRTTARGPAGSMTTDSGTTGSPTAAAPDAVASVNAADSGSPTRQRGTLAARETPAQNASASVAYRLAVANHVVGSEAMITAFRASAQRGDVDAQLAKWSHDLLGETRLLESAAPPDDVTLKRLLEDLDLVLAQIVQYTSRGTHSPEDLDLIDRSIRRRAVMSNLRNISAGRLPSGT